MLDFFKSTEPNHTKHKIRTLMPQGIKGSQVGLNLIPGFSRPKPPKPGIIHRHQLALALNDPQYAAVFYKNYCRKAFLNRSFDGGENIISQDSSSSDDDFGVEISIKSKEYSLANVDDILSIVESSVICMEKSPSNDEIRTQKKAELRASIEVKWRKVCGARKPKRVIQALDLRQEETAGNASISAAEEVEMREMNMEEHESGSNQSTPRSPLAKLKPEPGQDFRPRKGGASKIPKPKYGNYFRPRTAKPGTSNKPRHYTSPTDCDDIKCSNVDKNPLCLFNDPPQFPEHKQTGTKVRNCDDSEKIPFCPGSKIKEAYKLSLIMAPKFKENVSDEDEAYANQYCPSTGKSGATNESQHHTSPTMHNAQDCDDIKFSNGDKNALCLVNDPPQFPERKQTGTKVRKCDDSEKIPFFPGSKIKEACNLSLIKTPRVKNEGSNSDTSESSIIPRPITRNCSPMKADGSRIEASLRIFMDRYQRAREKRWKLLNDCIIVPLK